MRNACDSDSRCGLACDASTRDAKSLAMCVERCEPLRPGWGGISRPCDQGSPDRWPWPGVKSLCAVCGNPRNITFSSGCPAGRIGYPAGRIGDRGDREIVYVPNVYVPFPAREIVYVPNVYVPFPAPRRVLKGSLKGFLRVLVPVSRKTLQNPFKTPSRTLGKPFKKVSKSMTL